MPSITANTYTVALHIYDQAVGCDKFRNIIVFPSRSEPVCTIKLHPCGDHYNALVPISLVATESVKQAAKSGPNVEINAGKGYTSQKKELRYTRVELMSIQARPTSRRSRRMLYAMGIHNSHTMLICEKERSVNHRHLVKVKTCPIDLI